MDQYFQQSLSDKWQPLYDLIASHEDWLMNKILEYAKRQGYTKYTSTLAEAWRVSICGLSEPLMSAIQYYSSIPELDTETNYYDDPIACFGVIEAQRHRSRGVTLNLFFGLMKYYRQSYLDLLDLGNFKVTEVKIYELFINRFFDRIELAFCCEWISLSETDKLIELQEKNRLLTNEKNKYLTIFESINEAIFLFDVDYKIINLNQEAAKTFTNFEVAGACYYGLSEKQLNLPWLQEQVVKFHQQEKQEDKIELAVETNKGQRFFNIKIKKMLDVSEKFTGTVVICTDITELLEVKQYIEASEARLAEAQHIGHFANWTWNFQENKIYWSKEIYTILEEDEQNVPLDHQQFLSRIYPADLETFKQKEAEAIQQKKNYTIDFQIITKKNQIRWLHQQSFVICNEDNQPIKFMGILQDITSRKESELALQQSEERLRTIINNNVNTLIVISIEGQILFINPAGEKIFHKKEDELLGTMIGLPLVINESTELAIPSPNRELIFVEMRVMPISWENQEAYLVSLIDITDRKKSQEKVQMLYQACEQSPASIVITDYRGNIEYVNPKFEEVTGYPKEEVLGKNPRFLKSGYTSEDDYQILWQKITAGEEWHGEFHNKKKNGEFFWEYASISPLKNEDNQITHFVGVKEDITQRKKAEELLSHQANYDPLTDLPNRTLGIDRLKQAIAWAQRNSKYVAVIFLDLDHFKEVNDTLGHKYGDQLLIIASQRIRECLRKTDTVCRLGGDEFLIIISALDVPNYTETIAKKILKILQKSFILKGETVFISASIGISIYPDDSYEVDTLMQNADLAMYAAKRQGRNNFQFFTSILNEESKQKMLRENYLRTALKQEEIYLIYQPLIDLKTGKVSAVEALIRWHNIHLGVVHPDEFLPIAEETGLIIDLGEWALENVCQQMAIWQKQGFTLKVTINLSPRQFRCLQLAETISNIAHRNKILPAYLGLEITEQLLLEDIPHTEEILMKLNQLNFSLVMDDFGKGYASLNYLQKFPVKVLKIDQSFIQQIPYHQETMIFVKTIIMMAHSLNLKVVAEGIENQAQLQFFQEQNCDFAQGYFLSYPLTAHDLILFLQNNYS